MSAHRISGTVSAVPANDLRTLHPTGSRFGWPSGATWKALGAHIVVPLFLAAGMALAYLGGFHPDPHNVPVAIVGDTPQTMVFAQSMNDKAGDKLDVRTVSDDAAARRLVTDGTVLAAYEMDATHATILVASAASATAVDVAQKVFMPIAYEQHLPIAVDDLRAANPSDASGQGLFFLLVALTVGSYASAIAVAAVTAKVSVGWRLGIVAAVAGVIAAIGVIVAGPIYQVVDGNQWGVWLLAWLYAFGIISIGVGLHPALGKWTTPALTGLFVMLNVTSSGGVFPSSLMPPLFAGLNSFWNGAAWLDAVQSLLYFPGRAFGFDGLRLALWATAGIGLVLVTHLWSIRKRRLADESIDVTEEDEVIAA